MEATTEVQESNASSLFLLLVLVLLPPLICVGLLFITDLNLVIGRALGVNLPADENLVIYDALCWQDGTQFRVNVLYWSSESAPISARIEKKESIPINATAGTNTLEVILKERESCPDSVIIQDESRNRIAGSAVEAIVNDES